MPAEESIMKKIIFAAALLVGGASALGAQNHGADSLETIARGLENGELLSLNLEKFPHLYERRLAALLRVGEETGNLAQMLRKQGDELTKELEHRLRTLGNILEPALILVVGALVAVILVSMYLPMFKLGGIME